MTAIESINTGFYPAGVSEKLDNINKQLKDLPKVLDKETLENFQKGEYDITLKEYTDMNTYRYENRPYDIPYMELKMVDEEKSTPWKTVPPSWKNSSSKGGRTANQIKKDRKRKKMNKRK